MGTGPGVSRCSFAGFFGLRVPALSDGETADLCFFKKKVARHYFETGGVCKSFCIPSFTGVARCALLIPACSTSFLGRAYLCLLKPNACLYFSRRLYNLGLRALPGAAGSALYSKAACGLRLHLLHLPGTCRAHVCE